MRQWHKTRKDVIARLAREFMRSSTESSAMLQRPCADREEGLMHNSPPSTVWAHDDLEGQSHARRPGALGGAQRT